MQHEPRAAAFPELCVCEDRSPPGGRALEAPGLLSLVGFGGVLAPLPDLEIEALRSGLEKRRVEPHPYLVIGERVRIRAGALSGMEGVLVRKKSDFRVVLSLDLIRQSVAVEVDADDLEPARTKNAPQAAVLSDFAASPISPTRLWGSL